MAPATEGLPKRTAALARALDAEPPPFAALDLHQDNFIHGAWFYASSSAISPPTGPCWAGLGRLLPVLRSVIVDSGHEPGTDVSRRDEGFIVAHDGSITDRCHRRGSPIPRP
jgi:hypothetical protein